MIAKLYRKYISKAIREKIYDAFLGDILSFKRDFIKNFGENTKSRFIYVFRRFLPDTTENRLYAFMGKHGLCSFPYPFILEYKKIHVDCFHDDILEMHYVVHQGKKLYFPNYYTKRWVIGLYKSLISEQDIRSPHRYIDDTQHLAGKTLLDVGSAEGIFSLSNIEIINHAYLFECDENWIKALNATFAPWSEKISIIPKYVSGINDESNITIDRFLEGKDKHNLFLKMDIEGYEQAALKGAANTLKGVKDLDYAICTYHNKEDEEKISKIFVDNHFESEFTEGFFYIRKDFRKAVIRRKK
jgi:hypothetical protein